MKTILSKLILLALLDGSGLLHAADPFDEFIRSTGPRTPQEELKGFHLPPGFEIQLVASEPAIGKPMNMAFDEKGRLWVTQSREYPFPVPLDKKGRDTVNILDQLNAEGHAEKITTFAEGLNIPIGLYPYKSGAIVFSIPYIYYLQDTNGNGHADQQKIILGRLGFEKDTHGLTGAFRRGFARRPKRGRRILRLVYKFTRIYGRKNTNPLRDVAAERNGSRVRAV